MTAQIQAHDPFKLATLRKSGTHLLIKCLDSLNLVKATKSPFGIKGITFDKKEEKKYGMHLGQNLNHIRNHPEMKFIVSIRDVRDMLLSLDSWSRTAHKATNDLEKHKQAIERCGGNRKIQLLRLIQNKPIMGCLETTNCYQKAVQLYKEDLPNVLFVRFEDLVGPKGGGNKLTQINTIKKIIDFVNLKGVSDAKIEEVANSIYGGTVTFNLGLGGQIGKWKTAYQDIHVKAAKEHWNNFLLTFGYETDPNWDEAYLKAPLNTEVKSSTELQSGGSQQL